jgi:hypothetical protein
VQTRGSGRSTARRDVITPRCAPGKCHGDAVPRMCNYLGIPLAGKVRCS